MALELTSNRNLPTLNQFDLNIGNSVFSVNGVRMSAFKLREDKKKGTDPFFEGPCPLF